MFKKILIANRGEIALRIIKTARRMGVKTVAVYSEADRDSPHVQAADAAVCIGPAAAQRSYLSIENIIRAVKAAGAEAVHPGYGFLSENAAFVRKLAAEDIVFIGPPADAISVMGDKIESKKLAEKAGINVIPGHGKVLKDARQAVSAARAIGYPAMLKASAGGGGKGMRMACGDDQIREGFDSAAREAQAAFGDGRIFVEKFIERPRHIEIQVMADHFGNLIHLGERECSIQRRSQKILEESPSPFLDGKTRAAMCAQAVALAKAVKYVSAGTVEFLVDAERRFYFLEMNTRLQVEHAVTEMTCGLDLVELMIRIAAGERLALKQIDVRPKGWAMEARVYAEDPASGFLPSAGRLKRYLPPPQGNFTRLDSGVREGGEISIHYDPMIAKLIVSAETRKDAIARLRLALDEFLIRGVFHNIAFLGAVLAHPRFVAHDFTTGFIAEEFADGFDPAGAPHRDSLSLAAVAASMHFAYRSRVAGQASGDWMVVLKDGTYKVAVSPVKGGYDVLGEGGKLRVRTDWKLGEPLFRAKINGRALCVQMERRAVGYRLTCAGVQDDALVLDARAAALYALMPAKTAARDAGRLLSPMPGLLTFLFVEKGRRVKSGQELAIIEAMKMENVLRAGRDGVVSAVHANPGDTLKVDQVIMEFE